MFAGNTVTPPCIYNADAEILNNKKRPPRVKFLTLTFGGTIFSRLMAATYQLLDCHFSCSYKELVSAKLFFIP
ncbi:MAG TPA: hypothetical protein DCZ00_07325 [Lactococcus sp.]|nr:hypothetical protein [Lactococcus sp.]